MMERDGRGQPGPGDRRRRRVADAAGGAEEDAVGLTDVVPFLVEDMLKANGGSYQKGEDWASFVVTDGKLITGQNPASSEEAARKLLAML